MLLDNERFCDYILELCCVAGLTSASKPLTRNQNAKQVVYIDSSTDILLSLSQRKQLDQISNISHLFDIAPSDFDCPNESDNISFYSIVLSTVKSERSQLAVDTHSFLHTVLGVEVSIIFYVFEEYIMISMTGYGHKCILSNWISLFDEPTMLTDIMDISNASLKSSKLFFLDFVYSCARWYYTHPFSYDYAAFELFPNDFFKCRDIRDVEQEELESIIRQTKNRAIIEYGDDYVDQDEITVSVAKDFDMDLELLLLDIDTEEDDNPFGEDLEELNEEDDTLDEYEYDDIDPAILEDPVLLMKWLEKNSTD